jgi:amidase
MTFKDVWEVSGMTASCGLPELKLHRPLRDADAVARLRRAGVIPFGKTNVPTLAADHQSYNPVYGTTNNPWDIVRTPGGSSGGAAAAVAAGLTPLELGSDIGGSIRCPSHFCGVYGHKSSFGIVPMRGHIPPPPGSFTAPPLGIAGPIARCPEDLERALDVLVAPAEWDRSAWSVQIPKSRHERLDQFRVAVWADQSSYSVDSRYCAALEDYARALSAAGVHIDVTARPPIDPFASDDLYVAMLFRAISVGMDEEMLLQTDRAAVEYGGGSRGYPQRIARAVRMSHAEAEGLREDQQRLCRQWAQFFTDFDLILCPVMPTVAYRHDQSGQGSGHIAQYSRTLQVDGKAVPYLNGLQWPGLATVANLPATAIPTGRFIYGLPVGLQAIGPYLEDRTALRFAQLAAAVVGGFVAPPQPAPAGLR